MQPHSFTDPSQNFIGAYPSPLDAFFMPKSIAVIGAKDDMATVARTLLTNLVSAGFQGTVYPINPKRDEVLGRKCYKNLKELPVQVDLAIIITPAATVPNLVKECREAGVKAVIIISAGFKELGEQGALLEAKILEEKGDLRIIGPNCLGLMNPKLGLNASFAKEGIALPGTIAFISQSGAMCTAVLDWSLSEHIGFSAFVSIGSMIDVSWGDLIRYFGSDPNTHSILIYMETVGNARAFLSAAKEIALDKPIIVIKPGRSQEAAKAAASHTGSLTGSDEVFDTALERAGVLRVSSIAELFHMAEALGKQPRPKGPKLHIITNAGGPAVLATDAAVLNGAALEPLSSDTKDKLDQFLPSAWSHSNPIDLLGDAGARTYEKALTISLEDKNADGVLVILSPQDMTDPVGTAEALTRFAFQNNKPILASWMGGDFVKPGVDILNRSQIPTFSYPDDAAKSFATMWSYAELLQKLYETPLAMPLEAKQDRKVVDSIIETAKKEKRTILSEFESKTILAAYGIPTVKTTLAHSIEEAVLQAKAIGFPIVLKLYSHTITHKSDIGGVKLNLDSEQAVRDAYRAIESAAGDHFAGVSVQPMVKLSGFELIVGSLTDPQFGPILLFGAGGVMVEIFRDRALGLPPLNRSLAEQMMKKTKIFHALTGFRGKKAVSISDLSSLLVHFSVMIANEPMIKECDINPLLASHEGIQALDARIVLHEGDPVPLAIRPYPVSYVTKSTLKSGLELRIRPIRPEDEPALIAFHKALSEQSVRQRYFEFKSLSERTAHNRLVRILANDFDQQIALVAEHNEAIIGIVRLIRLPDSRVADLKMLIQDGYHGKGLGSILLDQALAIGKKEGIDEVIATVLNENHGMLHLLKKRGFALTEDGPYILAKGPI